MPMVKASACSVSKQKFCFEINNQCEKSQIILDVFSKEKGKLELMILVLTVFVISFCLMFLWIYKGEKKDLAEKKANIFHVSVTALLLAVIPTAFVGLSLLVLLGTTNTVNLIFTLHLSKNQLLILSICFFVYLFVLDNILERLANHIFGEGAFLYTILTLIRIGVFNLIGKLIGLDQTVSITIAAGVSTIILILEIFYRYRMNKSDTTAEKSPSG
ncbi:hypothetical protein [Evansella tamaricis]|uniref:Uncharacterized protein n=1 Tax=Evansella tamaricis TaxID=2069301 RepID=A0ABS6JEB6_9BACI|nr:hypothetical protein [Evansella tamaricis]MBU9711926.1 hypothetical protein [Evansella tamaricis]